MATGSNEHTVKRYDDELTQLRNVVLKMGGIVEDQIKKAVESLEEEDLELARNVIARDQVVNGLEIKADEMSSKLIALRQPVGSDLRMILSLGRTVIDLERIGDEAERIARMAVRIYDSNTPLPNSELLRDVMSMTRLASTFLQEALDSLARQDLPKALEIARGDGDLDQEFQAALRRLITYMMEDPRTIGQAINITFILKSLERIGDHAANIAEHVVYLIKGRDIRHADLHAFEQELHS